MSESSPPGSSQPPQQPANKLPPKREEKADFRVIRSAPPPESGPNLMPIVVLVAVIGVGVAGYLFTQREKKDAATTTTTTTTGTGTSTSTTEAPTAAPDFVIDKIAFYKNEGQFERALKYAQEKLKEYPNASDLKAEIAQLRSKLGLDSLANPDEGLRQITARVQAKQFTEALESVTALMDGATLTEPQSARAYFLMAVCHANLGNSLDAANAVKAAEDLGHSASECAALRAQFKL